MVFVLISFYWFFFGELYALIKGAFGVYYLADLIERKLAIRYGLRVCIYAAIGTIPPIVFGAVTAEFLLLMSVCLIPMSVGAFISWRGHKSKTR